MTSKKETIFELTGQMELARDELHAFGENLRAAGLPLVADRLAAISFDLTTTLREAEKAAEQRGEAKKAKKAEAQEPAPVTSKMIYRVEEWRDGASRNIYHFDTEHEAKAFKERMEAQERDVTSKWSLGSWPLYTHMLDALRAAEEK